MVNDKSLQQSNMLKNNITDIIIAKHSSKTFETSSSSKGDTAFESCDNCKFPLHELMQSSNNAASFTYDDTVTQAPLASTASSSESQIN